MSEKFFAPKTKAITVLQPRGGPKIFPRRVIIIQSASERERERPGHCVHGILCGAEPPLLLPGPKSLNRRRDELRIHGGSCAFNSLMRHLVGVADERFNDRRIHLNTVTRDSKSI